MSRPPRFPAVTLDEVRSVSPLLARLTERSIVGDLWSRPQLSERDRSIVTVSALIAGGKTPGFVHYFDKALDGGVTATEMSELVTQIAFYAGWSASFSAILVLGDIFAARGIDAERLAPVETGMLPVERVLPDRSNPAPLVREDLRSVVPDLVGMTEELLYGNVWLREGLDPRRRHLATVAALIALGKTACLPAYLESALRIGVTKAELSETITTLAFYVGWPSVLSAASAAKDVLEGASERSSHSGRGRRRVKAGWSPSLGDHPRFVRGTGPGSRTRDDGQVALTRPVPPPLVWPKARRVPILSLRRERPISSPRLPGASIREGSSR